MAKKKKAICFKMFGRFAVYYDGEELKLDKSGTTKAMQMLAMLIYYREGVPRETLLHNLYGDKDLADRNNNLRVTIFKLRKMLIQAGLPEDNYVSVRNDVYQWSSQLPTECDVWDFRSSVAAANSARLPERELAMRRKACALYTDEFLSHIGYEDWVVMESIPLKQEYSTCLRRLCEMLSSLEAYREIAELCTMAGNIYPYDEWQLIRIRALMAMKQYDGALAVYQEFSEKRFEELGLSPTEEMRECNKQITEAMESRYRSADEIYLSLVEKESDNAGAVYVSYSSFIDRFRFLQRISERSGESNYLVVANITHKTTKFAEAGKTDTQADEIIRNIFCRALRRTDTFTKYNASQYLLLLVGIDLESIRIVTNRINESLLKEIKGWKAVCRYRALPMRQPEMAVRELGWNFSGNEPEANGT